VGERFETRPHHPGETARPSTTRFPCNRPAIGSNRSARELPMRRSLGQFEGRRCPSAGLYVKGATTLNSVVDDHRHDVSRHASSADRFSIALVPHRCRRHYRFDLDRLSPEVRRKLFGDATTPRPRGTDRKETVGRQRQSCES
jgi:hypothetical protein